MIPGDRVRFIEPGDDDDVVLEVLEDRDERVLVRALELFDDWQLKPTSVYFKSDLEIAQ
jgi:hypothetical protein